MSSNDDMGFIQVKPNFDTPTEEAKAIFCVVGSALSTWTIVEFELANVYRTAAYPNGGPVGALAAFASVASFEARLNMISKLLTHTLSVSNSINAALLEEWFALADKCHKKNQKRNELAHGIVASAGVGEPSYWVPYFNHAGLVLEAMSKFEFHRRSRQLQQLSLKMIEDREASFIHLYDRTCKFREDVLLPVVKRKAPGAQ